jgi:hypothetical protein
MAAAKDSKGSIYGDAIRTVFFNGFKKGINRFSFSRRDLLDAMKARGLLIAARNEEEIAKNIGDIIYTFRFRKSFPKEVLETAPSGKMWILLGAGDARYEFRLITIPSLAPDPNWFVTKLHDATPEIVRRFKLNDEQGVLARIRYNRLIDLFCRCVAHSLQNHLRTKVEGIGQIEIDELYVGANRQGEHFIIPVQVKSEKHRLGVSQLLQDLEYCRRSHPALRARAIGAQRMSYQEDGKPFDRIVLFEFGCEDTGDDVRIEKLAERHFVLLPGDRISNEDFKKASSERREEEGTS